MKRIAIAFLSLYLLPTLASAQITFTNLGNGRVDEPKVKNIHGVVVDQTGKPIAGARVLIENTKDNTSRTILTDDSGSYALRGLPPDVGYEVRADFKGVVSERKALSAFLDREDNLISFQLNLATVSTAEDDTDSGPEIQTFDLVKLRASFEMPQGVPAPIPAVLLVHGYGENRKVWQSFRSQFLERGWAVMSLDLRGHGDSVIKNQRPIQATPSWRTNPREFPQDIEPALVWLKRQTRLDSRKIAVIGYDVGANLALIAGKYPEVKTVVAVNPTLDEAMQLAGSAQDFHPRSALVVTANAAEAESIKSHVTEPVRLLNVPVTGGTATVFQSNALTDAIFQWIKDSY